MGVGYRFLLPVAADLTASLVTVCVLRPGDGAFSACFRLSENWRLPCWFVTCPGTWRNMGRDDGWYPNLKFLCSPLSM